MASTKVVEKLALETIPHGKPYKFSWISKKGEVEVLCDVVPMEATHLLLGRPYDEFKLFPSFNV